jgi:phenylalanyl-tRNA synthetase beta chain
MICDGEKPVAVGGVMGGLNSEIEDATTRVLIESACFDPISIRKTSKALGLNTDASHRFERGVDPDGTLFALNRAAGLMADLGHGRLVGGTIDEDFRTSLIP